MINRPSEIEKIMTEAFAPDSLVSGKCFLSALGLLAYIELDKLSRAQSLSPEIFSNLIAVTLETVALCINEASLTVFNPDEGRVISFGDDLYFYPHELARLLKEKYAKMSASEYKWAVNFLCGLLPKVKNEVIVHSKDEMISSEAAIDYAGKYNSFYNVLIRELGESWRKRNEVGPIHLVHMPRFDHFIAS